ncbi:hypothetical protein F5146DRAFT_320646 [Armillaria mellea]|nr:hypothetical protein F5146DRAFT_320646 [Armillaria mellea]
MLETVLGASRVKGEAGTEGMTGLALSSSTLMGRPMTYGCMCYWLVHRDRRDGAGLRLPSSCTGNPPVFRFVMWVLAHLVPANIAFPRRLLIVATLFSEEGVKLPPLVFGRIKGWSIVWDVGRDVRRAVEDREQATLGVEGVHRRCMAWHNRYALPPGHNMLGDCDMIPLFPISSPILSLSSTNSLKSLLSRPARSYIGYPIALLRKADAFPILKRSICDSTGPLPPTMTTQITVLASYRTEKDVNKCYLLGSPLPTVEKAALGARSGWSS